VSPGTPNASQISPSVSSFLQGQPRWAGLWSLFNPQATSANNVWFEANATRAVLSWNNVNLLSGTSPTSFQMQFYPNGTVQVLWQNVASSTFAALTGWTTGGNFSDPGNRDLSAQLAGTFTTCTTPFDGLVLDTSAQPVLGSTLQWQLTRVPAGTGWGAVMRSPTQALPPVDLGPAGMSGCFAHVVDAVPAYFLSPGTSVSMQEVLPNVPALMGARLIGQAVTYNPGLTQLGLVASNAVVLTLGF
jgi:hypothetical protein